MGDNEYQEALKLGKKEYKACVSQGRFPYLPVLDDILSRENIQTEQNMGLMQIPLDFVVGTATKGRTYSFAANFMPILDADTEFACKWIALSDAQVNEGIRDPIVAYEYMNRYYVVEGNKRVSVLKYFKADSIVANVTRKIPKYSEDEDVKLYYEYMKFNQISGLNNIEFSKIGMVDKLLALMGSTAIWDADTRMEFNSLVNHFTKAYEFRGGRKLPIRVGDALTAFINVYGYNLQDQAKELVCENFYDNNKEIRIPLDPQKTARENSQKYFDKYGKLKRTSEALEVQLAETKAQIDHLESIQNSLNIALSADDLVQIKEELMEYGFIKKHKHSKKQKIKSKPFHYISSDGYDMYVGKNNYQNDELTFKFATGNDWWFHAKKMPGSHVIVKNKGGEMPDRVFEEAGKLAGYYSSGRDSDKLEIDYLQKKNVKKPAGSAPGFVVYYTNYSLTIHPDISGLTLVESSNT